MLPLRDTTRSRNYPLVNHCLIVLNAGVYLYQLSLGSAESRFIYFFGLVPARYTIPHIAEYFSVFQQGMALVSFMFLHGGFWHLLGNMWSLYIFGDNVEDRLGPYRYLVFYLLCGMLSGATHLLLNLNSNIPTIGASGAIAGVMGAYLLLYPHARILTVIPIFFFPWFVEIPAYFFLGAWFLMQFLSAAGAHGTVSGIAWWAHIGGFLVGMILIRLLDRLPTLGMTDQVRRMTQRKHSPRLHVIRTPAAASPDLDLHGTLTLTAYEAIVGTQKRVTLPGLQNRMFQVTVPPGTRHGTVLRLKGLGKVGAEGQRGDMLLKVALQV